MTQMTSQEILAQAATDIARVRRSLASLVYVDEEGYKRAEDRLKNAEEWIDLQLDFHKEFQARKR